MKSFKIGDTVVVSQKGRYYGRQGKIMAMSMGTNAWVSFHYADMVIIPLNGLEKVPESDDKTVKAINYLADHYGLEAQSRQTMEECGELIQALNKHLRVLEMGQATDKTMESTYRNVAEEISDVLVMALQIKHLLNISDAEINRIVKYKLKRSMERVQGEK